MSVTVRRRVVACCLALLASSMASPARAADGAPRAAPPPVEYFFGKPAYRNVSLSPDGRLLAADVPWEGHRNLALIDVDKHSATLLTAYKSYDLSDYTWLGDRVLQLRAGNLADASGLAAIRQVAIVDADGNVVRDLLAPGTRAVATVIARIDREGNDLIIQSGGRSATSLDAYRFNPRTNEKRLLTLTSPGDVVRYVSDRTGQVRAAVSLPKGRTRQVFSYRASNDDPWIVVRDEPVEATTMVPIAFGFDPHTLYVAVASPKNGGRSAIHLFDTEKMQIGERIFESDSVDPGGLLFDDVRQVLAGVRDDGRDFATWIDPEWKLLQESVDAALPNTRNRLSWARYDTSRIVVTTESVTQPPVFYLLDRKTHRMEEVAVAYPSIKEEDLSPRRFVHYRARDGLSIPAYLTLPKAAAGAKPPLIVDIHGGPFVQGFHFGYDEVSQFLASRGYAVLQPEFRGSLGYGSAFEQAGWKQWGLAMQDDITDGVRWLVDTGQVDADRVCLYGGSYGGYATLWGLEKEPSIYRCGIAFVAVSDLELLFDVTWSDTQRYDRDERNTKFLTRTLGDPDRDRAKMKEVSPLYHADRIAAPLLLAYGGRDVRVPLVHGRKMRSALDDNHKAYEWVVYDDEGHGFRNDANRYDFYRRIDAFLAKNLAPRDAPPVASTPAAR